MNTLIRKKKLDWRLIYLCLCAAAVSPFFYYSGLKMPTAIIGNRCPTIEGLIISKVPMNENCLLNFIVKEKTVNPSTERYNLASSTFEETTDPFQNYLVSSNLAWVEALIAVEVLAQKREKRNFFECGALDGVTFSTTLHLERFLNWTGILVEADSVYFDKLRQKHRKAFGVNVCLSGNLFPSKAVFRHAQEYVVSNTSGWNVSYFNPGVGHIVQPRVHFDEALNTAQSYSVDVLCVPVYSVLLALRKTTIDLFVLDVEGLELEVLKTIPFDKVDISVFLVEMNGGQERWNQTVDFFETKNYQFHGAYSGGMHPLDAMFIRNDIYDIEKLNRLSIKEAYKIVVGEKDESKIAAEKLNAFGASYLFSSEVNFLSSRYNKKNKKL